MNSIRTDHRRQAARAPAQASPRRRQRLHAGKPRPNTYRPGVRHQGAAVCVMEWGKLYAGLPADTHVQAAEDDGAAFGLLAESMCYLTSAESGGFIPDSQVRRFLCFKPARVTALVREELWVRTDGRPGYLISPRIWTEERNLSDSAEKKRAADRSRMRDKRAAANGGGRE